MEAIRNYLETMFSNLPNTPEVIRAKSELWQMMEDKYTELKSEGKSENEAVGTVIAEFGNLDELSEDLGIRQFMHPDVHVPNRRMITMEEARNYLKANFRYAFQIALGVFLCILSPVGVILLSETNDTIQEGFGVSSLFICITFAVMLFVIAGIMHQRWNYVKKELCTMDFSTTTFVNDEKERNRLSYCLFLTIGIALCILSVLPVIIIESIDIQIGWIYRFELGPVLLLLFVATGVFMIIISYIVNNGYNILLEVNAPNTIGGNFVPAQKSSTVYSNDTVKELMSLYWPTITCIYLSISFLTFLWGTTWVIWPIAAIAEAAIKSIWKK